MNAVASVFIVGALMGSSFALFEVVQERVDAAMATQVAIISLAEHGDIAGKHSAVDALQKSTPGFGDRLRAHADQIISATNNLKYDVFE